MFDINPQSHRHYLSDIDRQMQPQVREYRIPGSRDLFGRLPAGAGTAILAVACLVLGGVAAGTFL